ncbi:MAG: hypothetical protein J6X91_03990 [Bacteroidales bacterium]|nr:hypothetical protein [Bacteroidales bacterium]
MKKPFIIATVAVAALLLCTAAQSCRTVRKIRERKEQIQKIAEENKEYMHLEFMGLPMAGSSTAFARSLKARGFEEISDIQKMTEMTGTVDGLPVEICLMRTPKTGLISRVALFRPNRGTWSELEAEYLHLKDSLLALYPYPAIEEVFDSPFKKGDGKEIQALQQQMCTYESDFYVNDDDVTIGIISVSIVGTEEDNSSRVMLLYLDIFNYDIECQEKGIKTFSDIDEDEPEAEPDSTESNNKPIQ